MAKAGAGTIRGREVRDVVADLMRSRSVPAEIWSMTYRGELRILVNDRVVEIDCPRGQTFYSLQRLLDKISRVLDERERVVADPRQIDIEDAIRASAA